MKAIVGQSTRLIGSGAPKIARKRAVNLAEQAYDRLEEAIVSCALPPGLFLSIPELQTRTGVGRTPTHQAVSRLHADTLVVIRPRHGLQIAPIDLARERTLLELRRDLERFAVRLAIERASASHHNQMLFLRDRLRELGSNDPVLAFNKLDRRIDQVLLAAAGEVFLEHSLRPLHTLFRRIGWIYYSAIHTADGMARTVECHLAILDAVTASRSGAAIAATDGVVALNHSMIDALSRGVDPALFDCNLEIRAAE